MSAATPVTAQASVLILEIERSWTLKSTSRRNGMLWGLVATLAAAITVFALGVPVFDPAHRILGGGALAMVISCSKCVQHMSRYRQAARNLATYEAAFEREFSSHPAFDALHSSTVD